jgi:hypothetical protein
LRNSFKYASKRDWAQLAKDLKPVYTAASEVEALDWFAELSGKWEKRYPAIIGGVRAGHRLPPDAQPPRSPVLQHMQDGKGTSLVSQSTWRQAGRATGLRRLAAGLRDLPVWPH